MHPAKFAVLAFFALSAGAVGLGAILAAQHPEPPDQASPPQNLPTPKAAEEPAAAPPSHHWVARRDGAFGYQSALSANDLAAGLASRSLTMITFNGIVQGDYSFTTYNPVTGAAIIMRCSEPCEFMNVMNYDHRMTETYPVAPGSIMQAIVQDARAGQLNP